MWSKWAPAVMTNCSNEPFLGGANSNTVPEGFSNRFMVPSSCMCESAWYTTSAARIQSKGFMASALSPHNSLLELTFFARNEVELSARFSLMISTAFTSPSVTSTCLADVHVAATTPARPMPAPKIKTRLFLNCLWRFKMCSARTSSAGDSLRAKSPWKKSPCNGFLIVTLWPRQSYVSSLQPVISSLVWHSRGNKPQSDMPSGSGVGTADCREGAEECAGSAALAAAASEAACSSASRSFCSSSRRFRCSSNISVTNLWFSSLFSLQRASFAILLVSLLRCSRISSQIFATFDGSSGASKHPGYKRTITGKHFVDRPIALATSAS
mmetsp:Transcript_35706/g.65526  ORF Transcript_35706/g.65526 Transcript_35706/m.65526 type:complete len:326 (-) Transcript_35706:793-1770(-)